MTSRRNKLWSGLVLLGLLGAAIIWNRTNASSASELLAQTKADLRARGERLDLHDFPPPDPSISWGLLFWVLERANTNFPAEPSCADRTKAMNCLANGRARPVWSATSVPLFASRTGSWEKLNEEITSAEPALLLCRRLFSSALNGKIEWPPGVNSGHQQQFSKASQWLQSATLAQLYGRNLDGALTNLLSLISTLRIWQGDRDDSIQLLRQETGGLALATTWEALQTPGWSEEQLAQMQSAWEQVNWIEPFINTMEVFRAWANSRGVFASIREAPDKIFTIPTMRSAPFFKWFPAKWRGQLYLRLRVDQDELQFVQRLHGLIESGRIALNQRNWQVARSRLLPELEDRFILTTTLLRTRNLSLLPAVRLTLMRDMACTAIAIQRYQLKHARPPHRLDELVPDYLSNVPIDYMNGQPLLYRVGNSGDWLLYSVGPDGIDNQGEAGDQSSFQEDWTGPDWVWPRAVQE